MKILEAKIEFEKDGKLKKVAVLVDFTHSDITPFSDIRAIVATTKPIWGYTVIQADDPLSIELIKRVAAYGRQEIGTKEFPGWKKRHKA